MLRYYLHAMPEFCIEVLGGNGPLDTLIGSYASLEEAKSAAANKDLGGYGGRKEIIGLTAGLELKLVSELVLPMKSRANCNVPVWVDVPEARLNGQA